MKKTLPILLLITLILSACSNVQIIPEATPDPNAAATLGGFTGSVWLQETSGAEPAQLFESNSSLLAGERVSTLADSSAQVKIKDGTIVRLGAMTDVVFTEFSEGSTRLTLLDGKLWVILAAGSLDVDTAFGTASVSGSYLGVSFDVENQILTATCLEGTCNLENENGATALASGQTASVKGADQFPSAAEAMSDEQLDEWVRESPEAAQLTGRSVPTLEPVTVEASAVSADQTWIPYYFENNCTTGEYASSEWNWGFQRLVQSGARKIVSDWYVNIPPGEARSGLLPPGMYSLISETLFSYQSGRMSHRNSWANINSTDMKPYEVVLCPDQPRLPSTAPGVSVGMPAPTEELPPLTYWLGNNCLDDNPYGERSHTNWHWTFIMVSPPGTNEPVEDVDVEVIIPPGESRSGTLPPGYYRIKDWTEEGSVDTPEYVGQSGEVYLNLCPDNQHLPGDPYPSGEMPTQPAPTQEPTAQPVSYSITLGCSYSGVTGAYHFLFVGPVTIQVDMNVGQTRTGTLPTGKYQVYGWWDYTNPSNVQAARNWVIDPDVNPAFSYNNCDR